MRYKKSSQDKTQTTHPPLTLLEKRRMMVYMLMCVANIIWNIVYGLPYGLLTLYAENNVDRHIWGMEFPSSWLYGIYGVFIIILSPFLAVFYQFLKKKKKELTLSRKLALGYLLVALGCAVLLPTVAHIASQPAVRVSPWGFLTFYFIFALSELFTIPVLLSAATHLAPAHYVSRMVSFNMVVSWSIGAWIAGVVAGWTIEVGAVPLFLTLVVICSIVGILHLVFENRMEKLCAGNVIQQPG